MTDTELKNLKDNLWHSADMLRASAHLAANKYGQPILGLIFLRYADVLYKQHKAEIDAEYNLYKGTRMELDYKDVAIEKCGFFLPECAYFDTINDAPDKANKALLVKQAMEAIERENPRMEGVLPKEVYGQLMPKEEPELLSRIVRVFKDIPENISIDIFGQIYEYFLGNFALAEGQGGGAFYTPASVVQYMVEVLQPTTGDKKFLDPACGSGGMFVQAARYMHRHNATNEEMMHFRCYGVEKEPDTVKLAKMNLLLNHIRGEITEANSFYSDPYSAFGQFDYVMANPPFNVDEVVLAKVIDKERFNTYGVPRNKTKSTKKASDKTETVPNANYLWIGYFATALNDCGKAAFVMANSASDAGGSELEIRKKMIMDGIISQMVTLPSNMFSTVTLPATLWFFDKSKPQKDEILFIDARNIFTQVDRAHRKFSDEQIKNLGIISRLYEGDSSAFWALVEEYKAEGKQSEVDWLLERWPEGKYQDVVGLCKVAKLEGEDGIIDNDYSLNAGRYVGVVIEDDGMTAEEFRSTMRGLNADFSALHAEAAELAKEIETNLKELFGEE
ncbi:MAG: class I SAM-dependent DNA methyltransferase [Parabacteroides sp.]|nr:class I SAM-dependent DNA methyltransferase [Parabacteroides sp.]